MKINPALFHTAVATVAFALEELLRTGVIPAQYVPVAAAVSVAIASYLRPPAKGTK